MEVYMVKIIKKDIVLLDGQRVTIDIAIPIRGEVIVTDDDFIKEILVNQITRGLKGAISDYKKSELPDKFIQDQKFIITNKLPWNVAGFFNPDTDTIYADADVISDFTCCKANYFLGREEGNKIMKYRNTTESFEAISSALGIGVSGNEELLKEVFIDICGSIVASDDERTQLALPLEEKKKQYVKRYILRDVYRV